MSMTVEQLFEEVLQLPDNSKVFLAEQLVQHLESRIDKNLERIHLEIGKTA